MTRGERFDIDSIKPKIERIVSGFDRYLDGYPARTNESMHRVMGPVPMILDGARTRKESVQTLMGRAVRMHEMRAKGYLPPKALEALEKATNELLELCNDVPPIAVTKVTERIRYSVYYERRKKGIEWFEQTLVEFIDFLRQRYADDAALAEAWNEKGLTLNTVRFPSNKAYQEGNETKKKDIDEFRGRSDTELLIVDEGEDDE